jgi:hypothetical protein
MTATRRCPRCQQTLDAAAFGRDRRNASGLQCYCKSCRRTTAQDPAALARRAEYMARYYTAHREQMLARRRARWRDDARYRAQQLAQMRDDYRLRRRARARQQRPCIACGETMPVGRYRSRCGPCVHLQERERRLRKRAENRHHCRMCRAALSLRAEYYCSACQGMLQRWRHAWHAGDPVARRLGIVRAPGGWPRRAA